MDQFVDAAATERAFRESSGRAVATLVRFLGDIDLAEEAVQEAFTVAVERWPQTGVPDNPGGWITTKLASLYLARRFCMFASMACIERLSAVRSSHGFNCTNMVALFDLLPKLTTFKPPNAA